MVQLLPEQDDDSWEVESLLDLVFGQGRRSLSSYRIRESAEPVRELCHVARDDIGPIVGSIRYWPITIGRTTLKALLLGPVAVHPTRQGEGLGSLLIQASLATAEKGGWERVVLIGDEPYYGRFGFRKLPDVIFPPPTNPDRVLGLELAENAFADVSGRVEGGR